MDFGGRLTMLMGIYGLSNSKLARALNIDPSLVSKWKTGKRVPSHTSQHIKNLAAYFAENNPGGKLKEDLANLLHTPLPEHDRAAPLSLAEALYEWLLPSPAPGSRAGLVKFEHRAGRFLVEKFSDVLNLPPKNVDAPPLAVSGFSYRPAGEKPLLETRGTYHLFKGYEGKRQASMLFLESILSLDKPAEILLISQESTRWITETGEFLRAWAGKLGAILQKGHRITIIHFMMRNLTELTNIMEHWIPLHMTGNISSYYYPRYANPQIKFSYFIIRGKSCIVTYTTEDSPENNYSFYYSDPMATTIFEGNFDAYLEQCRPLLNIYKLENMADYMEMFLNIEEQTGDHFTFKNNLSSITMPLDFLTEILVRSGLQSKEIERRLSFQKQRLHFFAQNIKQNKYCEIVPLHVFGSLREQEKPLFPGSELFIDKDVPISVSETRRYLQDTISVLEQNENYEIFFAGKLENKVVYNKNLFFKAGLAPIVSCASFSPLSPVGVTTGEGNMVEAFSLFFEDLLAGIPNNRRKKSWTIAKLKEIRDKMPPA